MLCCSTSVLQTSQPATNQTYRSLHCCWRIYVMTPCIQWKDFLPRLLLVSVSGGGLYIVGWKIEKYCNEQCEIDITRACHFCSIFDNLVYCAMLSEPRVGFSFHFLAEDTKEEVADSFVPFVSVDSNILWQRWHRHVLCTHCPFAISRGCLLAFTSTMTPAVTIGDQKIFECVYLHIIRVLYIRD